MAQSQFFEIEVLLPLISSLAASSPAKEATCHSLIQYLSNNLKISTNIVSKQSFDVCNLRFINNDLAAQLASDPNFDVVTKNVSDVEFEAGKVLQITCIYCLDHGGGHKKDGRPKLNPCIGTSEALMRFQKSSGLSAYYSQDGGHSSISTMPLEMGSKYFGSSTQKSKMNLLNRFQISGCFKVADGELFKTAYLNGVGKRRSYGYGMIVLDTNGREGVTIED